MLSIFKMSSKIVKNLNSYKADFFLNSDRLNPVLADQLEAVSFSAEFIVQSNLFSLTSSDIDRGQNVIGRGHLILAKLVHIITDLRMTSAVSGVLHILGN